MKNKPLAILKKIACLIPGVEMVAQQGSRYRGMWNDTNKLEDIAIYLETRYVHHEIETQIVPFVDSCTLYNIEVRFEYGGNSGIPIVTYGLERYDLDRRDYNELCEAVCSEIDKALFDHAVIEQQKATYQHLEENWPEVVADLTLNNLYNNPKK